MARTNRPLAALLPRALLERLPAVAVVTMAMALVVGLLGQRALDRHPTSPWAWAPLVGGAAVFALLARRQPLERVEGAAPAATQAPRLAFLVPAVILAALAFPGFAGNRFRPLPTGAWLLSLALLYHAFRRDGAEPVAEPSRARPASILGGIHLSWHALALLGVLVVGAVLRLRALDVIPREMGVDMPLIYENAREIMQGQFMIFCPRYPGRESLYHYLLAVYGSIFGLSYFAIKFVSALCGLATLLALYGLARYLFDREVALVAAALMAISKWHVILSRSGYRAAIMPLVVILVLWTTVRALRRGRGTDFVLAGAALGLGTYTYNSFLIVPFVLVAALALEFFLHGGEAFRRYRWGVAGLGLAAAGVFVPLGRYALEQPGMYLFRVATRVTSIERPLPQDLLSVFLGNLWRAAAMFNLRGDGVFYINVPFQRELGLVSGALFVFGLAYAVVRWRQGHNAMVLVFLGGLLLPTALAVAFPQEVPNAIRASGALVAAYLLAALPIVALGRRLYAVAGGARLQLPATLALPPWLRWQGRSRVRFRVALLLPVIMAGLLCLELGETWHAYFQEYVRHLPGRNYAISLEMARTLDQFDPEGPAYVKTWPHWFDGNALRAQLKVKDPSWDWELPTLDPAEPPLSTVQGKVLFIVHPDDEEALQSLRACFARGVAVSHRDYEGRVAFVAFYAER